MFDQLHAPQSLQSWFGRPPLRVADLIETGMVTMAQVSQHYSGKRFAKMGDIVYPTSIVFPMGFSWSSYVAQNTMLHVCALAGLKEDRILADDMPPPK